MSTTYFNLDVDWIYLDLHTTAVTLTFASWSCLILKLVRFRLATDRHTKYTWADARSRYTAIWISVCIGHPVSAITAYIKALNDFRHESLKSRA